MTRHLDTVEPQECPDFFIATEADWAEFAEFGSADDYEIDPSGGYEFDPSDEGDDEDYQDPYGSDAEFFEFDE